QAVAFDVLLSNPRPDHGPVPIADDRQPQVEKFLLGIHPGQRPITITDSNRLVTYVESDDYFAWQLKRSGRGILAAERGVTPLDLFVTNALAIGDISADPDSDGVLRKARAFQLYTNWNWALKWAETNRDISGDLVGGGIVLSHAEIVPGRII